MNLDCYSGSPAIESFVELTRCTFYAQDADFDHGVPRRNHFEPSQRQLRATTGETPVVSRKMQRHPRCKVVWRMSFEGKGRSTISLFVSRLSQFSRASEGFFPRGTVVCISRQWTKRASSVGWQQWWKLILLILKVREKHFSATDLTAKYERSISRGSLPFPSDAHASFQTFFQTNLGVCRILKSSGVDSKNSVNITKETTLFVPVYHV